MGSSSCSGFHTCSGVWICSGCKFVPGFSVRFCSNVFGLDPQPFGTLTNIKMCHNISSVSCCSGVFCGKLVRSLRESLLKKWWKKFPQVGRIMSFAQEIVS